MINTLIHKLDDSGTRCVFCDKEIKGPHQAKPGEYVGVNTSSTFGTETAYRIGENNRDSLCNGDPSGAFHQASESKR